MTGNKLRVLIVDDHPVVRRGLKQVVADASDVAAVGEASRGSEVLDLVRAQEWDVVVLDIAMPGRNGLEVLRDLKHERPNLPVLILSMYPEDQYAVRALRAGAAGYLTKDTAPDELLEAIRKVARGGTYVTPSLSEQLVLELNADITKPPHAALSNREDEVMRLIASGKTVGQIAEQLLLSVKTISTYRARVLAKMQIKNNAQLMHYAITNGLVD